MSTITLRSVKGSPLTNNEVDANFSNLNSDKIESADAVSTNTANKIVKRDANGDFSAGVVNATTVAVTTVDATDITADTLTGTKFQSYTEKVTTTAVSASTFNLDLSLSNIFDITLNNSVTFTFTNAPASGTCMNATIILRQGTGGNKLATFTNAKYTDAVAPVLSTTAGQIDVLSFFTVDGGASYFGSFSMANVS